MFQAFFRLSTLASIAALAWLAHPFPFSWHWDNFIGGREIVDRLSDDGRSRRTRTGGGGGGETAVGTEQSRQSSNTRFPNRRWRAGSGRARRTRFHVFIRHRRFFVFSQSFSQSVSDPITHCRCQPHSLARPPAHLFYQVRVASCKAVQNVMIDGCAMLLHLSAKISGKTRTQLRYLAFGRWLYSQKGSFIL